MSKKMKIQATLENLYEYDQNDMVLWVIPGSTQTYWKAGRNFRDDYVVARPSDFAEAEGWTDFGWEDIEDDFDGWQDIIEIEVELK